MGTKLPSPADIGVGGRRGLRGNAPTMALA
jgi:hypothetical protein